MPRAKDANAMVLPTGPVQSKKHPLLLIQYKTNWGDEMDIEGFSIRTAEEWNTYLEDLERVHWPREISYGTNEGEDMGSADEFLEAFTVTVLTDSDHATLTRLLGGTLGHTGFVKFGPEDFEDSDDED